VRIELNGERRELPEGASLLDAVRAQLGAEPGEGGRGLAVALDGEVVPRSRWALTALAEGGRVDVLAAIQGGAPETTDLVGIRSGSARP
jgi:sulfur carrier protein